FMAGKERTQEEFLHTFNALYDGQKQIVISSDCPPREIPTLKERLHSRFEWGLIADMEPPDLDTKVAILKRKADLDGVQLPDDVLSSKNHWRQISFPRQVAMCLCKRLTKHSFPEIGREFGGKHHTTVIHSVEKIEALLLKDPNFHRVVSELIDNLCR